uniref:S-adenosylmethionine:tRNA ribosyltransferase-isomerase n=1 Tax=candidate division WOR-3 bacterium TaxID=2052148 RepID=A0A7C6AAP0_UNCW3
MLTKEFDYYLPKELIAQSPIPNRDESRLLILSRQTGEITETIFREIVNHLSPTDLLVLNDTKVIKARIFGVLDSARKIELLLLREIEPGIWETLARPARKVKPGSKIKFGQYEARVIERKETGVRIVKFSTEYVNNLLNEYGEIALPPYIKNKCADINRYQTIYGTKEGAIAAPTAGLHFTCELLQKIRGKGITTVFLTLHCSLGTFRPIKVDKVEEHKMYPEEFEISSEAAAVINQAKAENRRLVAVGTTVVRALEARAFQNPKSGNWMVTAGTGLTNLYIYPGYQFKIVDALITNFHLPKSTLLLLVCAFADREKIFKAYDYAIAHRFRFYSFGDAMMII